MKTPTKSVTKAELEALRVKLDAMPKKEKTEFTPREAVISLAEIIHRIVDKDGYSFSDVAAMLKDSGVELQPSTISSYLRDFKPKKSTSPARKIKPVLGNDSPTDMAEPQATARTRDD